MAKNNSHTIEILLVEDNPADARKTVRAAEDLPMVNNIAVVETGIDALKYLHREPPYGDVAPPDLIILDLNLPGLDGRDVLERIKAEEGLKRVPVVVLTTSDDEADILKAYDLHANAYVQKPLGLDEFTRITKAIDEFWLGIVKLPHR